MTTSDLSVTFTVLAPAFPTTTAATAVLAHAGATPQGPDPSRYDLDAAPAAIEAIVGALATQGSDPLHRAPRNVVSSARNAAPSRRRNAAPERRTDETGGVVFLELAAISGTCRQGDHKGCPRCRGRHCGCHRQVEVRRWRHQKVA